MLCKEAPRIHGFPATASPGAGARAGTGLPLRHVTRYIG